MADDSNHRVHLFPTTRWSQVEQAANPWNTRTQQALDGLLRTYVPVFRSYLLFKKKIPAQHVDDLVQGFITQQVMEKNVIASARRDKGRFRNYIRVVLDRYVVTEYRRSSAAKRGQGRAAPLDHAADHADPSAQDAAQGFDLAWARAVLACSLEQMQDACRFSNRSNVWAIFELRLVRPILHGQPEIPYRELIQRLGLRSPSQATNLLTTGKRMFIRTLRSVIGQYAGSEEQIDQEIADLFAVLSIGDLTNSSPRAMDDP